MIRSTAGPDSTACVAQAETLAAPHSSSASAPLPGCRRCRYVVDDQAVLVLDVADEVHNCATLVSSRRLSMMASPALSRFASDRARSTPPASGETGPSGPSVLRAR